MKRRSMLILGLVVLATACMPMPRKRPPELRGKLPVPEVAGSPSIRLDVDVAVEERKFVDRAIVKARRKLDYLGSARDDVASPDYTIRITAAEYERSMADSELCTLAAYSLFVIPCWEDSEVRASAQVFDAAGERIGRYAGYGGIRTVYQLHLVYVLPVAAPVMPAMVRRMWSQAVQRALTRAGTAIAEDQRTKAARAALLDREPHTGPDGGLVLAESRPVR